MVNLGIIGLGKWAGVLARAASKSEQIKILQGFSRSKITQEQFCAEHGVLGVHNATEILENPSIQGVILTVPNELHFAYAEMCAKAGKHVYIEKPIANTLKDAKLLKQVCEQHGVRVFIGHCAKLLAGVQRIKQAIDADELGDICIIEGTFTNERALSLTPKDWRWYSDKAPGGPLSQIAIHQFDVLRFLGGKIDTVSAVSSKRSPVGAEVEDQWLVNVQFESGALGNIISSWTAAGLFEVRVIGTKAIMLYQIDQTKWGMANRLHEGATLAFQRVGESATSAIRLPVLESDMFLDELELFSAMVCGAEQDDFSAAYGLEILGLVESARLSDQQSGQRINFPQFVRDC